MKKGKHHVPGAVKRGKDIDNGIRFEAKLKARLKRRKAEKAGRRAARRK
jgi:hypothetical protein